MVKYPVAKPYITAADEKAVLRVLRSGVLSLGPAQDEFERRFAKKVGTKYACAVSSGTAGLHLALLAAGIGRGDEVITSPFSFVASANAVLYVGAKPVFADIDPLIYNLDPREVAKKITRKTKAVLVVHIFGQPADMTPLMRLAKKHNLKIIEDACESLDATYRSKRVGTFGESAVFAFYPNKQITSVRYGTPVLIKEDGVTKLVKIGSLMDFMIDNYWKPEGYECLAFDKNGGISWRKVNAFIKHDIHSEILKIYLEKGREAEITKSHSVFTIKNEVISGIRNQQGLKYKIKEVLGRNLRVGDYLIVPRKLPSSANHVKEIDVLDYIDRRFVKFNKDRVIDKKNKIGGGGGKYINRKISVNEKFCKLLGYFAAEGSYEADESGGGLRFTFGLHEKDSYVKEVKEIFSSIWPEFKVAIFGNTKTHRCTISCGGLLHSELLRKLGCGKNVYEKDIPPIIWDVAEKNKLAFIDGLLNGDGHRRIIGGSESRKLKVASENLANGLHYLLLTLGILSRLERKKYYSRSNKLRYSYSCELLGFEKQMTSKENTIPIEFLSLTDKSSWLQRNRIRHKRSISVKTLKKWMEQKQIACPEFLLADIAVLKIKKIEKEKLHEFVYDFEVRGKENFVGGYGAICLHNTGEGGMIVTNDRKIWELCRSLRNQGRAENMQWLDHTRLGYNYRLTEMSAALGLSQLERFDFMVGERRKIAGWYAKYLKPHRTIIQPPVVSSGNTHTWFVYVVRVIKKGVDRNKIIEMLGKQGMSTKPYLPSIHLFDFYRRGFGYKEGDFPIAEEVSRESLALPIYVGLKEKDVKIIAAKLVEAVSNYNS